MAPVRAKTMDRELPSDVEALKALVLEERARVEEHKKSAAEHKDTIAALEHRVAMLSKWLWGPRTEKRPKDLPSEARESWLPFADLLEAAQRVADQHGAHGSVEIEAPKTVRTPSRRRSAFPEHLPRVRTTIEVAERDRICCGQPMSEMGLELTRELERVECAVVHEIARKKYCCRLCQEHVLTAPSPTRPIEGGLLGIGWLAHLLVERFGHHMPYHRLEKKYASEGLALSRTVLCRSALEAAELLEPVYGALRAEAVAHDVCFADETSVKVQDSKGGGSRKAQMWLYASKAGDHVFDYHESRGRESPAAVLEKFRGYLHDDGYAVYESALDPEKVKHVACWAHVRRKFVDAEATDRALSREAVATIARLYAIDAEARERELGVAALAALRAERAPAILAGFKEWLDVRKTQVLPQSPMGRAIQYALGRWEALQRFLDDGRLELDNNRAERALRAVAVGRKNWIQIGNERGGKTAAVFYSLVATCKARGIDPKTYLRDVLLRRKEGADPATLTPKQWKELYASEVAQRRDLVLAEILGALRR